MKLSKRSQFVTTEVPNLSTSAEKVYAVSVGREQTGVFMVADVASLDGGSEKRVKEFKAAGRSFRGLIEALKAAGHEIEEDT